jgi:hypothetical protein
MGAYIVIYEVQPDGRLQETCSKMTDHVITSMAHDGSYLYLSGNNGIQIYDGTDYGNPQLVGSNPLRYLEWATYIAVWGDSLYYWWDDPEPGGLYLGIMDVSDPSVPTVVGEFDGFIYWNGIIRPQKFDHYLIIKESRSGYPYSMVNIIDLNHPSGNPTPVDSIQQNSFNIKAFDNRLYLCDEQLYIYEFINAPHAEFRSQITMPALIRDFTEVEIGGNRYGYVCSRDAFIYKINLNDLANPFIVDSLVMPENLSHDFRDIEQYGDYSYAMTSRLNYYVEHPGVHVIDWTLPGGPEMVQTAKKYSYCNTVKVIGDVAYAETDNDGILVVDLSDKTDPHVVDLGYALLGYNVAGDSNTLYAQNGNTVKFYDLSDPLAPVLDWNCQVPISSYYHVNDYIVYDTLLISDYFFGTVHGPAGVIILGISDRNNVQVLFDGIGHENTQGLHLDYPRLYVPNNNGWVVEIYDISVPTDPEDIGTLHNMTGSVSGVGTYENYIYVAGGANRVYHWNQWNQIIFDRLLDARPEFMVEEQGRMFFWGTRELGGPGGVQVWDVWQDPVNPVFSGYHFDGTLSACRKVDVEWPYAYIPGGDKGLVVLRYDPPTGIVEGENNLPNKHKISITNYPNPFNSSTTIKYILPEPDHVRIDIYDLVGRKVQTLVNKEQQAGTHSLIFDASNLSSGVYFSRIQAGNEIETRPIVLLK